MSVTETMVNRRMTLAMNDGVNANGTAKTVSRSYSNLNELATPAQMHATATALSGLMDDSLCGIYYDDKKLLQEVVDED